MAWNTENVNFYTFFNFPKKVFNPFKMSESTGFLKNLYIKNDLTLADQIRLTGALNGEKYRIVFPESQPSGGLSVLGVNSVNFDTINLTWLSPSQSLPFDVINCNQLNANGKDGVAITANGNLEVTNGNLQVTNGDLTVDGTTSLGYLEVTNGNLQVTNGDLTVDGTTSLGYLEAEIVNAKKSGSTETSGFLVSPAQVESNIGYFLPAFRPSANGQVLTSQTDGTMSWTSLPISPSLSAYRRRITGINETLTSGNESQRTATRNYTPSFTLPVGAIYKITTTFSFSKTNGTSFYLACVMFPLADTATAITDVMFANQTAINDVESSSPYNDQTYQNTCWYQITSPNTQWQFQVGTGAVAGGVCVWNNVEAVFEPSFNLITDN